MGHHCLWPACILNKTQVHNRIKIWFDVWINNSQLAQCILVRVSHGVSFMLIRIGINHKRWSNLVNLTFFKIWKVNHKTWKFCNCLTYLISGDIYDDVLAEFIHVTHHIDMYHLNIDMILACLKPAANHPIFRWWWDGFDNYEIYIFCNLISKFWNVWNGPKFNLFHVSFGNLP